MIKKIISSIPLFFILIFTLCGCSDFGINNISSTSVIYGIITAVSLLLIACYCILMKKREPWLLIMYIAVFIVNYGYLSISVSKTLEGALLSNRIAYFGSVFLPYSFLLTIMDACKIKYKKSLPIILICISITVFLIAASPGYLDWYYKDVSIEIIDGVAVLKKVYGPLHPLYLVYLLGYFSAMIGVIIHSVRKKYITTGTHTTILAASVLGNIAVWGIEQIIDNSFEFLSVSYIATELFLLMLFLMLQQYEPYLTNNSDDITHPWEEVSSDRTNGYKIFCENLATLTTAEKNIYNLYIDGKSSKEIMEILVISENTLKTHNRNIYKKLGISSRKQMLEYAKMSN